MKIVLKHSLLLLAVSGCSYSEKPLSSTIAQSESISGYDYEYYCGNNAAVSQFGSNHPDLIVDLSNKIVVTYVSDSDKSGYADGYHKALDIIVARDNKQCPDLH